MGFSMALFWLGELGGEFYVLYLSLWLRGPGERIALEVMRDNELKRLDVTGGDRADFYKQIS